MTVELPTGSGKTLVGLLIAEWRRQSLGTRVACLYPSCQLAPQAGLQTDDYEIEAHVLVGSQRDYSPQEFSEYQSSLAIALTTYSGVFNIKPRIEDAQTLILDDAHAGEKIMVSMWSVEISRSAIPDTYLAIVKLLRDELDSGFYSDISDHADRGPEKAGTAELIAGASIHRNKDAIRDLLAPIETLVIPFPHQEKTDAFHRLIFLLDTQTFPDVSSVTRERVQPYVIRTEKRHAITAEGNPLFKPRKTKLASVSWGETHRDQQFLYEAVTEYVRKGYNQAMHDKRSYIGILMILMQRLVVSSTTAILTTLERRLEALEAPQKQLPLFPMYSDDERIGQEQIEKLLITRLMALKNERAEVKLLLEAATRCVQSESDTKAEALLDWLYKLQAEEGDPELKVLVFTEFVPTQQMLQQFLTERGFQVVCLNGSMNMEERKKIQEAFAEDARILISIDAGGGLNLQFCHVVINYDIPWNPMRLEQHIGRVDRIGQTHVVRAVNFVFEDSVEHWVERMTMSYFRAHGGETGRNRRTWNLRPDGGKIFTPTTRHLWDRLLSVAPSVRKHLEIEDARNVFDRLLQIAEEYGRFIYDELVQVHRSRRTREKGKGEYTFTSRRKIIERIRLPQVRDYRLNLLRQEKRSWNENLERKTRVYPEMIPLLLVRVEGGAHV